MPSNPLREHHLGNWYLPWWSMMNHDFWHQIYTISSLWLAMKLCRSPWVDTASQRWISQAVDGGFGFAEGSATTRRAAAVANLSSWRWHFEMETTVDLKKGDHRYIQEEQLIIWIYCVDPLRWIDTEGDWVCDCTTEAPVLSSSVEWNSSIEWGFPRANVQQKKVCRSCDRKTMGVLVALNFDLMFSMMIHMSRGCVRLEQL